MMYFSQMSFFPDQCRPEKLAEVLGRDLYSLHQMLWQIFPDAPDAKRDFMYRQYEKNGWPGFYVVSRRKPQDIQGLFSIKTKAYSPKIYPGNRFAFSLKVNPVITRKKHDGKSSRHDVVMDKKYHLKNARQDIVMADIVRDAGIQWLNNKSEKSGFIFDPMQVRVEAYVQHKIIKPGKPRPVRFSTLDYKGLLSVNDAQLFVDALYNGIGPSKAFGCGLMLIRRI